MRNLWILLHRHAFLLAFIALLGFSLSVLVRNDGSARSSWFAATGGLSAAVEGQRLKWSDYLQLGERNAQLNAENAQLRSRLLSMELAGVWTPDTAFGWGARAGELVKAPNGTPTAMALAVPGSRAGIRIGDGVLAKGVAFGTVVDVGERYTRILPLLNAAGTWSCRVGQEGNVAPLTWNGSNPSRLQLSDVPRYATVQTGDTIFTSGFDLRFPEGIPVGTVHRIVQGSGDDFQTLEVAPLVDFTSARHLEFISAQGAEERNALAQPLAQP